MFYLEKPVFFVFIFVCPDDRSTGYEKIRNSTINQSGKKQYQAIELTAVASKANK